MPGSDIKFLVGSDEIEFLDIIDDNNFLFAAVENRMITRIVHIFEKRNIPINKDMLKKKLEENLINNLMDQNTFIIEKYLKLISQ